MAHPRAANSFNSDTTEYLLNASTASDISNLDTSPLPSPVNYKIPFITESHTQTEGVSRAVSGVQSIDELDEESQMNRRKLYSYDSHGRCTAHYSFGKPEFNNTNISEVKSTSSLPSSPERGEIPDNKRLSMDVQGFDSNSTCAGESSDNIRDRLLLDSASQSTSSFNRNMSDSSQYNSSDTNSQTSRRAAGGGIVRSQGSLESASSGSYWRQNASFGSLPVSGASAGSLPNVNQHNHMAHSLSVDSKRSKRSETSPPAQGRASTGQMQHLYFKGREDRETVEHAQITMSETQMRNNMQAPTGNTQSGHMQSPDNSQGSSPQLRRSQTRAPPGNSQLTRIPSPTNSQGTSPQLRGSQTRQRQAPPGNSQNVKMQNPGNIQGSSPQLRKSQTPQGHDNINPAGASNTSHQAPGMQPPNIDTQSNGQYAWQTMQNENVRVVQNQPIQQNINPHEDHKHMEYYLSTSAHDDSLNMSTGGLSTVSSNQATTPPYFQLQPRRVDSSPEPDSPASEMHVMQQQESPANDVQIMQQQIAMQQQLLLQGAESDDDDDIHEFDSSQSMGFQTESGSQHFASGNSVTNSHPQRGADNSQYQNEGNNFDLSTEDRSTFHADPEGQASNEESGSEETHTSPEGHNIHDDSDREDFAGISENAEADQYFENKETFQNVYSHQDGLNENEGANGSRNMLYPGHDNRDSRSSEMSLPDSDRYGIDPDPNPEDDQGGIRIVEGYSNEDPPSRQGNSLAQMQQNGANGIPNSDSSQGQFQNEFDRSSSGHVQNQDSSVRADDFDAAPEEQISANQSSTERRCIETNSYAQQQISIEEMSRDQPLPQKLPCQEFYSEGNLVMNHRGSPMRPRSRESSPALPYRSAGLVGPTNSVHVQPKADISFGETSLVESPMASGSTVNYNEEAAVMQKQPEHLLLSQSQTHPDSNDNIPVQNISGGTHTSQGNIASANQHGPVNQFDIDTSQAAALAEAKSLNQKGNGPTARQGQASRQIHTQQITSVQKAPQGQYQNTDHQQSQDIQSSLQSNPNARQSPQGNMSDNSPVANVPSNSSADGQRSFMPAQAGVAQSRLIPVESTNQAQDNQNLQNERFQRPDNQPNQFQYQQSANMPQDLQPANQQAFNMSYPGPQQTHQYPLSEQNQFHGQRQNVPGSNIENFPQNPVNQRDFNQISQTQPRQQNQIQYNSGHQPSQSHGQRQNVPGQADASSNTRGFQPVNQQSYNQSNQVQQTEQQTQMQHSLGNTQNQIRGQRQNVPGQADASSTSQGFQPYNQTYNQAQQSGQQMVNHTNQVQGQRQHVPGSSAPRDAQPANQQSRNRGTVNQNKQNEQRHPVSTKHQESVYEAHQPINNIIRQQSDGEESVDYHQMKQRPNSISSGAKRIVSSNKGQIADGMERQIPGSQTKTKQNVAPNQSRGQSVQQNQTRVPNNQGFRNPTSSQYPNNRVPDSPTSEDDESSDQQMFRRPPQGRQQTDAPNNPNAPVITFPGAQQTSRNALQQAQFDEDQIEEDSLNSEEDFNGQEYTDYAHTQPEGENVDDENVVTPPVTNVKQKISSRKNRNQRYAHTQPEGENIDDDDLQSASRDGQNNQQMRPKRQNVQSSDAYRNPQKTPPPKMAPSIRRQMEEQGLNLSPIRIDDSTAQRFLNSPGGSSVISDVVHNMSKSSAHTHGVHSDRPSDGSNFTSGDMSSLDQFRSQLQALLIRESTSGHGTQSGDSTSIIVDELLGSMKGPYGEDSRSSGRRTPNYGIHTPSKDLSDLIDASDFENMLTHSSKYFGGRKGQHRQRPVDLASVLVETQALKEAFQKERYRRKHCEQQIQSLQSKILELQQQLAVAISTDQKKDTMIQQLDKTLAKVVDGWKKKEQEKQEIINKLNTEVESAKTTNLQQQQRTEKLESELRDAVEQIAREQERTLHTEQDIRNKNQELKEEKERSHRLLDEEKTKYHRIEMEKKELEEEIRKLHNQIKSIQRFQEEEREAWSEKEQEYLQKVEDITENHLAILEKEKEKFSKQSRILEETQKVMNATQREMKTLEMEIEATSRERESLKVQIGIMEAKMENNQRRLQADMHAEMQRQVSLSLEEAHRKQAEMERELLERHKRQMYDISQQNQRDLEQQACRMRDEFGEKEERFEAERQQWEDRNDLIKRELDEAKDANRKLDHTRMEIGTKLQSLLQSHCNDAMRMINAGANPTSSLFTAMYSPQRHAPASTTEHTVTPNIAANTPLSAMFDTPLMSTVKKQHPQQPERLNNQASHKIEDKPLFQYSGTTINFATTEDHQHEEQDFDVSAISGLSAISHIPHIPEAETKQITKSSAPVTMDNTRNSAAPEDQMYIVKGKHLQQLTEEEAGNLSHSLEHRDMTAKLELMYTDQNLSNAKHINSSGANTSKTGMLNIPGLDHIRQQIEDQRAAIKTNNQSASIMLHPPVQMDRSSATAAVVANQSGVSSGDSFRSGGQGQQKSGYIPLPLDVSNASNISDTPMQPQRDAQSNFLSTMLPDQGLAEQDVSYKLEQHESRQKELQSYIGMLLNRSPGSPPESTNTTMQNTPPRTTVPSHLAKGVLSPQQVGEISRLLGRYRGNNQDDQEPKMEDLLSYLTDMDRSNNGPVQQKSAIIRERSSSPPRGPKAKKNLEQTYKAHAQPKQVIKVTLPTADTLKQQSNVPSFKQNAKPTQGHKKPEQQSVSKKPERKVAQPGTSKTSAPPAKNRGKIWK